MPMERSRYPKNWDEIALSVKQAANWMCQHCKRPCKQPDERWDVFLGRVVQMSQWAEEIENPVRFVLTTAHLDQDPSNNEPSNLAALCSVCHLRHDRPFRQANRQRRLERRGQLNLFFSAAGRGKDVNRVQPTIFGGDVNASFCRRSTTVLMKEESMEINEQSSTLMSLYLQIQQIEESAKELSRKQPSRELSLSITNLQQARLWLTEGLAVMEENGG